MNLRNLFPISRKEGIELKELLLEVNKNNEIIKEKYEKTITFQNEALELTLNKLESVLNDNKILLKNHKEMDLKLEEYQSNIDKNNEIIKEKYEKTITFQNEALELTLNKFESVLNDNKILLKNHKEMDLKLEEYQGNISDLENKTNETSSNMNGVLNLINKLLFKDLLKNYKKEVEKIIEG